ncbi:MAG: hypothetical protein BroJett011_17970 [Chloroflexota bacterium]|nr:MAG: hypothetical protein BroJett011_17970 [Chloroflexota bacterium]
MRTKLKKMDNIRTRFRGVFSREGKKFFGLHETRTLLLTHIKEVESGQEVADHLWFNYTKGFEALGPLTVGDMIEFDARVAVYKKGYYGRNEWAQLTNPPSRDYKLSRPTRIELVKRHQET